jgi:flavin-dependent dehydrogenase
MTASSRGTPVVLGASLSGLLVSLSLSRAGIDHVLVGGDEPPDAPRLGESLNEVAGPELWRCFGREFPQFFLTKSHISLFNRDYVSLVYVGNPLRSVETLARHAVPDGDVRFSFDQALLFHLDRAGFDRALYRKARSQPRCTFVAQRIARLHFDRDTDRVRGLALADGTELREPGYVFDAGGGQSAIAEAAALKTTPLGEEQRVVWGHWRREEGGPGGAADWWLHGTNLLRLHRDLDGIDGVSWLIPLGQTVSLGISIEAGRASHAGSSGVTVMRLLAAAYERRGLHVQAVFPREQPIQDITQTYFIRERAFGHNWALVGGTFIQIWYPSSTGIWAASAAAGLAPRLVAEPERIGTHYESILRSLLPFHGLLGELADDDGFRDEDDAYRFWTTWGTFLLPRVLDYLRITHGDLETRQRRHRLLARLAEAMRKRPGLLLLAWPFNRIGCYREADLPRQTAALAHYFGPRRFRAQNFLRSLLFLARVRPAWATRAFPARAPGPAPLPEVGGVSR